MKVILDHEEVRQAIRLYVKSKGYEPLVDRTVNQNTGLLFHWDKGTDPKNPLTVEVKIKQKEA